MLFSVPQVPGRADVEQRPRIRRKRLPGHDPADVSDGVFGSRVLPQIIDRETVLAHGRQNFLRAVRQKHGAQHLVAADQPVPRGVEPVEVHVRVVEFKIDVARNLPQLVGPDPADPVGVLHVRQRERLETFPFPRLHGGQGRRVREGRAVLPRLRLKALREMRDVREPEKPIEGQFHAELLPHFRDEVGRDERVPAELKEVVQHADLRHLQNTLPEADERAFQLRRGPGFLARLFLKRREGLAIQLAVGGQGQRVERHERGGRHVFGDAIAEERPQLAEQAFPVRRWLPQHQIGPQPPDAPRAGNRRRHGVPHQRMLLQGGFDFAQFDAVPADLHLTVGAAEEFDGAVRPEPSEIARPVPARSVELAEAQGRQLGIAQIAAGDARPADPQLAVHPVRAVAALGVHHPVGLPGQRASVGNRLPLGGDRGFDFHDVRPDGGFRGPAHRDEPGSGGRVLQPLRQIEPDPVSREHGQTQREPASVRFGVHQQHVEQDGHRVPDGDAAFEDDPSPLPGVAAYRLVDGDDGRAGRKHSENVVYGKIEIERRHGEARVALAHVEPLVDVRDGVPRAAVLDGHALGLARGA